MSAALSLQAVVFSHGGVAAAAPPGRRCPLRIRVLPVKIGWAPGTQGRGGRLPSLPESNSPSLTPRMKASHSAWVKYSLLPSGPAASNIRSGNPRRLCEGGARVAGDDDLDAAVASHWIRLLLLPRPAAARRFPGSYPCRTGGYGKLFRVAPFARLAARVRYADCDLEAVAEPAHYAELVAGLSRLGWAYAVPPRTCLARLLTVSGCGYHPVSGRSRRSPHGGSTCGSRHSRTPTSCACRTRAITFRRTPTNASSPRCYISSAQEAHQHKHPDCGANRLGPSWQSGHRFSRWI